MIQISLSISRIIAMIKCWDCGRVISGTATTCPGCGAKIKETFWDGLVDSFPEDVPTEPHWGGRIVSFVILVLAADYLGLIHLSAVLHWWFPYLGF